MFIFTIAAENYFAKALQLAHSIRLSQMDAELALIVVESPSRSLPAPLLSSFDHIFHAIDLGYEAFDSFMFRHTIVEASTAIKPRAFMHLLSLFPREHTFIYLDPDINVYSPFKELNAAFLQGSIVVTPHLLMNEVGPERIGSIMFEVLKNGIFNLGFLAVRRSDQSHQFLKWWKARTESWCYNDQENGLFVDQKWIDFAVPFTNFSILLEPGYNVAFWNVPCRRFARNGDEYTVNMKPLRFIHFSNVADNDRTRAFLSQTPATYPLNELVDEYLRRLSVLQQLDWSSSRWSYGFYESGEEICKRARLAYRSCQSVMDTFPNPFSASNKEIISDSSELQSESMFERAYTVR